MVLRRLADLRRLVPTRPVGLEHRSACRVVDKKPRTEVRGRRAVGRSRICVARGTVFSSGVPRLPPGASCPGLAGKDLKPGHAVSNLWIVEKHSRPVHAPPYSVFEKDPSR